MTQRSAAGGLTKLSAWIRGDLSRASAPDDHHRFTIAKWFGLVIACPAAIGRPELDLLVLEPLELGVGVRLLLEHRHRDGSVAGPSRSA